MRAQGWNRHGTTTKFGVGEQIRECLRIRNFPMHVEGTLNSTCRAHIRELMRHVLANGSGGSYEPHRLQRSRRRLDVFRPDQQIGIEARPQQRIGITRVGQRRALEHNRTHSCLVERFEHADSLSMPN